MEALFHNVCDYAPWIHLIFFGLLLLAGLNLPISEDAILITGGMLASTCMQDEKWHLYAWIYAGCILSGWEVYWLGRLVGPKLYKFHWFQKFLPPERVEKMRFYFAKYGIFTFIFGHFVPGGARNALYLSAGFSKMYFPLFVLRDGVGCLIATMIIFHIGIYFGENYLTIIHAIQTVDKWAFFALVGIVCIALLYRKYKKS